MISSQEREVFAHITNTLYSHWFYKVRKCPIFDGVPSDLRRRCDDWTRIESSDECLLGRLAMEAWSSELGSLLADASGRL